MTTINISEKFTVNDFSDLINNYYSDSIKSKIVLFNLEILEWLSLEALTLLFGWINNIKNINENSTVNIRLPNPNSIESDKINEIINEKKSNRRQRRLISLLETWKFRFFCDIDPKNIIDPPSNLNSLIEERRQRIYFADSNWRKIVPFRKIDTSIYESLDNIRDNLDTELSDIFKLEKDIKTILNRFSTDTPFNNKTLSHLITVELLLNTLHHAKANESIVSECYFAVTLLNKFNVEDIEYELTRRRIEEYQEYNNCTYQEAKENINEVTEEEVNSEYKRRINKRLPRNIESERTKDTLSYFKDHKEKAYINRSYVEFVFLDFGSGIPKTLESNYHANVNKKSIKEKLSPKHFNCNNNDSQIIEYAFLLNSSRNPFDKNIKIQDFVPRGLYFLLDIIKLYKGLLVVRSRKGEVIFDFSKTNIIRDSVTLSENNYDFPGTMINVLIPEQTKEETKIEPIQDLKKISVKTAERIHISILDIYRKFLERYSSENSYKSIDLYNYFFNEINTLLDNAQTRENHTIIYLDFAGANLTFVDYKIFYFLANTPKINKYTNIVLLNIIDKELLKEVRNGLMSFEPFIFRPIPCIIEQKDGIDIAWIGIKSIEDEKKLNELLKYDNYTIPSSDFKEPELLTGNVIEVNWLSDKKEKANLQRSIFLPSIYDIDFVNSKLLNEKLKERITNPKEKDEDIFLRPKNAVFLTSGGYYQYEFLKFIDLLFNKDSNNRAFSEKIAISLFNTWRCKKGPLPENIDWILTVTLSSQMLGRDVRKVYRRLFSIDDESKKPKLLKLAHYYEFSNEIGFEQITEGDSVLVVNDVISTGSLNQDIYNSLISKKAKVVAFFTIVDCRIPDNKIDKEIEKKSIFNPQIDNITISLVEDFYIHKYLTNIKCYKNVIKINPIINAPTTMNLEHSENVKIIFPNITDVLNRIKDEHLLIGYFINNKSFHTYFPNTEDIFLQYSGKEFLKELIEKIIEIEKKRGFIEKENLTHNANNRLLVDYVFYPVFSGIEAFEDYHFQKYFNNKFLRVFPIPRIDTVKGWRFTFPPKILNKITEHKTVFILDDGSCSGETILQMIDSICFLDVSKIIVLSVFGRLEDFQREFFSRIKMMKVKNLKSDDTAHNEIDEPIIETHIYFGTHLNIHHFPFEKSTSFIIEKNHLESFLKRTDRKPKLVIEYINNRLNALQVVDIKDFDLNNYKIPEHFPIRKNDNQIDVVRIYEIRNIIGRLDSYRIYKQYYDNTDFADDRDLELIIGIVNHEPQILETIKHLLPELFLRLKKEINKIVFEQKFNLKERYFLWKTESLLMFLFIIDFPILYNAYKLKLLFEILNNLDNNRKALSLVTYELWRETIGEGKNGEAVRASIFNIWYPDFKNNNINTKQYRLLTSLIDSFNYKENISSIAEAFSNLHLFFAKESAKPGHKQLEQNINNAIPTLQDFSKKKFDIVEIEKAINGIKYYIKNNIDKINENDFVKLNIESIYLYLIGDSDSIYKKMVNIIDLFDYLSEYYHSEEIENYASKLINIRSELAVNLIDFNGHFVDVKRPFAQFCLNFYTNPIDSWKKVVLNHSDIKGYKNINFNIHKLESTIKLLFPIHREALEKVYYNILYNACEKAKDEKLTLEYVVDNTNGVQFFSIEQNKPYITDENRIDSKGIDIIENIIRSFNGDVLMPVPDCGDNMYYHLIFLMINKTE